MKNGFSQDRAGGIGQLIGKVQFVVKFCHGLVLDAGFRDIAFVHQRFTGVDPHGMVHGDGVCAANQEGKVKAVFFDCPGSEAETGLTLSDQRYLSNDLSAAAQYINGSGIGTFGSLAGIGDAAAEKIENHLPAGVLTLEMMVDAVDQIAGTIAYILGRDLLHVRIDGVFDTGVFVSIHIIPELAKTPIGGAQDHQGVEDHKDEKTVFSAFFGLCRFEFAILTHCCHPPSVVPGMWWERVGCR